MRMATALSDDGVMAQIAQMITCLTELALMVTGESLNDAR